MERFRKFARAGFNSRSSSGEKNSDLKQSKSKKKDTNCNKPKSKENNADFNHQKDNADFNHFKFVTDYKEVKFSYTWRIKNIHLSTLKYHEFLESPIFSTRFCGEVKWIMRIYTKGRFVFLIDTIFDKSPCNGKHVGLFLHKISENPVKSSFRYRFICERHLLNNTSKKEIYTYPNEDVELIDLDSTDISEYGTDDVYRFHDKESTTCLFHGHGFEGPETLVIRCDIYVTNVFNTELSSPYCASVFQSGTLFQDLNELFETGKFSDVTLQARDVKFSAHKNILASRSKVFDAMFQHDMKEAHTDVVQIEDIEPAILGSLLQYIYAGRVKDFNVEKAISLYPVADKYFLDELKNWCADMMLRHMTVENICHIALLADLHPDPKLKEAVLNMFRNYTSDIFKRKEWQDLIGDANRHALVSEILRYVSTEFITNCEDN